MLLPDAVCHIEILDWPHFQRVSFFPDDENAFVKIAVLIFGKFLNEVVADKILQIYPMGDGFQRFWVFVLPEKLKRMDLIFDETECAVGDGRGVSNEKMVARVRKKGRMRFAFVIVRRFFQQKSVFIIGNVDAVLCDLDFFRQQINSTVVLVHEYFHELRTRGILVS